MNELESQRIMQELDLKIQEWDQRRSHFSAVNAQIHELSAVWDQVFAPYEAMLSRTLPYYKWPWYMAVWPLTERRLDRIEQRMAELEKERDEIHSTLTWNNPLIIEAHRLACEFFRYSYGEYAPCHLPIRTTVDGETEDGQMEKHVVMWTFRNEMGCLFSVCIPAEDGRE